MKTLYLETNSGISGDMTVAALLDLGADEQILRDGLASLKVDGYDINISRTQKCGLEACDFDVILHHESGHEHEREYGHEHEHAHEHGCGHGHGHGNGCGHGHKHEHSHDHGHEYDHVREHDHAHSHDHDHSHDHAHRGIVEITELINAAAITDNAKAIAIRIFNIIAKAEAKVHGKPVNEVHFHEVGAVDSIVDIVGAAICLDNLGIEKVFCTPLREGQGTVWCQHGRVPVPAPATLEIAAAHKIPIIITKNNGEMVTPTGAAIIAAVCESFDAPEAMTVVKTGYGAGKKDFAVANVLRASIVELNGEACVFKGEPVSGIKIATCEKQGAKCVQLQAGGEACVFKGEPVSGIKIATCTKQGANDVQLQAADEVLELACNIDDMTAEQLAYACELMLENGALDCWQTAATMKKGRQGAVLSLLIKPQDEEKFTRLLFLHTSTIGVRIMQARRSKMMRRAGEMETAFGMLAVKECEYGDICKTTVEYESAKKLANAHHIPIEKVYSEAQKHLK